MWLQWDWLSSSAIIYSKHLSGCYGDWWLHYVTWLLAFAFTLFVYFPRTFFKWGFKCFVLLKPSITRNTERPKETWIVSCVSHLYFSDRHRPQPVACWTPKQLEIWRLRLSLWKAYCSAGNKVIQIPVTWNSRRVCVCTCWKAWGWFSLTFQIFLSTVHLK